MCVDQKTQNLERQNAPKASWKQNGSNILQPSKQRNFVFFRCLQRIHSRQVLSHCLLLRHGTPVPEEENPERPLSQQGRSEAEFWLKIAATARYAPLGHNKNRHSTNTSPLDTSQYIRLLPFASCIQSMRLNTFGIFWVIFFLWILPFPNMMGHPNHQALDVSCKVKPPVVCPQSWGLFLPVAKVLGLRTSLAKYCSKASCSLRPSHARWIRRAPPRRLFHISPLSKPGRHMGLKSRLSIKVTTYMGMLSVNSMIAEIFYDVMILLYFMFDIVIVFMFNLC